MLQVGDTCFPPAEAGTISPKSGESSTTGQQWSQVSGDATETAIGVSGSAEANSIHLASNGSTCGSGFFCQEGSFQSASEAHFSFSCLFGSLQVLARISTMACPAFSKLLVSDKSLGSPCEWQVWE